MKAIVWDKYGPPEDLGLTDVDMPVVGEDSVLVRVRAASVNPAEWRPLQGRPYLFRLYLWRMKVGNLRRPRAGVLGSDVSGHVEAVGRNVTQFKPGHEVYGVGPGAFAEYVSAREQRLVLKPARLTFEQAAAIPIAAVTALQGLRDKGRIRAGQRVLINGAAGGVGTFAVQIAKAFGAEVTAVCSTRNVDLVRSLGADRVIDYTKDDFTRGGQRYAVILDNAGSRSLSDLRRVLDPEGIIVMAGAPKGMSAILGRLLQAVVMSRFSRQKILPFLARITRPDLLVLNGLTEEGKVTPVIDRTYPLSEVPAALRYLETGHARAKVVITV
jgi:NADPH:quinone reductase-like Zn-dependent oxidoreductase